MPPARSGTNVLAPALAAGVVDLVGLAADVAPVPVALDEDAGDERAVHLVAPAAGGLAVEPIGHGRSGCRSHEPRQSTTNERGDDRQRSESLPEHRENPSTQCP